MTSGTTSGTSGSIRKALVLSTHTAPRLTASGSNLLETAPPAEAKTRSTPSNTSGVASSIVIACPLKLSCLPAERLEASNFTFLTGIVDCSNCSINREPTAPVAPKIATVYSLILLYLLFIKYFLTQLLDHLMPEPFLLRALHRS